MQCFQIGELLHPPVVQGTIGDWLLAKSLCERKYVAFLREGQRHLGNPFIVAAQFLLSERDFHLFLKSVSWGVGV